MLQNSNPIELDEVRWYVMRAHQKEERAETALQGEHGLPYFIAKHTVLRTRKGQTVRVSEPVIYGMIFVKASRNQINEFKMRYPFMHYVMCRHEKEQQYLVVPDSQMDSFIKISTSNESDVRYYDPTEINLKRGAFVRIHGGAFDGAEGYFVSVKGRRSKQFVVTLDKISAVSVQLDKGTYLEPIPDRE